MKYVIYWCRRDFRLHDNPAIHDAVAYTHAQGATLVPIFVIEDYMCGTGVKNAAQIFGLPSQIMVSHALTEFAAHFTHFAVVRGKGAETIIKLARALDAPVFVNDDVYPDFYAQVKKIQVKGVTLTVCEDALTAPKDIRTKTGNLYSVFTPFKNAVWSQVVQTKPLPAVSLTHVKTATPHVEGVTYEEVSVEALQKLFAHKEQYETREGRAIRVSRTVPLNAPLYTGEASARARMFAFLRGGVGGYKKYRDFLGIQGTSHLSTALAWGLLSSREIIHHLKEISGHTCADPLSESHEGETHFIAELIWREFYRYVLVHRPHVMYEEFQEKFRGTIAWLEGDEACVRFDAWCRGETGYPIVDAAIHELNQSGYMHNRARMIVSSVLTKNLGVDWRWGQAYFQATLYDIDEASNNGGWQWGASVGADPKPIRIFNPYLQAENYDKDGVYQRMWLPESYQYAPPTPLVPHKDARVEAQKRYGLQGGSAARDY